MVLFSIIFTSKVGDNSRHVATAWSFFSGEKWVQGFVFGEEVLCSLTASDFSNCYMQG